MKFIFLTMEVTNNVALREAVMALNAQYKLDIDLRLYNVSLLRAAEDWEKLADDIKNAAFIFGSMLFSEEVVRPLETHLSSANCPVCIITSNPALIKQTRLGKFILNKPEPEESSNPIKKLMGKLKPKHGHGESQRQLGIVRNLMKVLKMIPGKAKDVYTFIAAHQYWLNGSQENIFRMLSLFVEHYIPGYKGKIQVKEPLFYPETALFHPESETHFESMVEYKKWQRSRGKSFTQGRVAILSMRASILGGNTRHLSNLVHSLESKGLEVCIAYSGGLDFRSAIQQFFISNFSSNTKQKSKKMEIDVLINATGFSLVGGPAESRPKEAQEVLKELGIGYMEMIPLAFQRVSEWKNDMMGLSPIQLALSVAIPELDGATEPRIIGGPGAKLDRIEPIKEEIELATERIFKRVQLHRKSNAEKKLAIVLFNFPPNLGNIGTAAYLDVFASLFKLLHELKQQGYKVELPESAEALREAIVNGNHHTYGTTGNVHDFLTLNDYKTNFPTYHEIESFWGNAPGELLNDGERFYILGQSFGNIFIGQQPSFGYERDPMRLLMAKDAAPHHGFAAFYTWLNHQYQADVVLHFGTHGALEFMPGKQNGLSASCWPTRLLGHLPNVYYYCVNNPSEATIAKRRSSATIVSYMAPPLEKAGLYKELRQIKDLIESYHKHPSDELIADIKQRAHAIELVDFEAITNNISSSTNGNGHHPSQDEQFLTSLNHELLRIEERMIPLGLHELGKPSSITELCDILTMVAHFATPSGLNTPLPHLIAGKKGWNFEQISEKLSKDSVAQQQSGVVQHICHKAIKHFINASENDHAPDDASISFSDVLKASYAIRKTLADDYLHAELNIKPGTLSPLWEYLNPILINLIEDRELKGLVDALNGAYIEPSAGNDVIRNPMVLPTGRNIHSLDPFRMPSDFAWQQGKKLMDSLLQQSLETDGRYPESLAIVLWGTDNLKSDGEGIAQVFWLLGAKPKEDELGNISDVELIPLEELKRPRIDTVVTVSGIFRDLLTHQMKLIDKAARMAAKADEPSNMNYVRKHALAQSESLNQPLDEVSSRVFSNAPGSYGANVNHLVESSTWESDSELCDAFVSRKCFTMSQTGEWKEKREVFEENLLHVDMAFQNIDSFEIGISDIDHYYEYLGGISKSVEMRRQKKPKVMVADAISTSGERLSTLENMVKLETRTKTLNPKWYESMLKHGYEGVHEIEAHVSNTYGWSATAEAVDDWVYQGIADTYMHDKAMRDRLSELNPHATAGIARRLLEANSRGFWDADDDTIENLKHIYQDLEDRLERASEPI